jgi:4a-hydroxytetrahydrobiopterin dehydratase
MASFRLDEPTIVLKMAALPSWTREGDEIVRHIVCSDFRGALRLINDVGEIAEEMDHHPDILLHGWNKVKITLATHSVGGLTDLDFHFAAKIDALA